MTSPKVYIANPIAGKPNENIEYARFLAHMIEDMGAEAVVPQDIPPFDHVGECPEGYAMTADRKHTSACALRSDLKEMLDCNAVLLGEGWEDSVGVKFERTVAQMTGIPVLYITDHTNFTVIDERTGERVVSF